MGFGGYLFKDISGIAGPLLMLATTCASIGIIILVIRRGILQDPSSGGTWRSYIRFVLLIASIFFVPQLALWVIGGMGSVSWHDAASTGPNSIYSFDLSGFKDVIKNAFGTW